MRHALLALLLASPAAAQTPPAAMPAPPKVSEADALRPLEPVAGCGERRLPAARRPALNANAWRAMQAYHAAHGGIGLIVLRDGRIERESYAPGMSAGTRTMSQSMAKTVTALALGQAVADGVVPGPDRPLKDFLAVDDAKGAIPLRAFLTMSSGLQNPGRADPVGGRLMFGPGITEAALSLPVEKPADAEFKYSNASSQIVGAALAAGLAKKGETYAQYLSRRLWCPLGNAPASLWVEAPGRPRFYAGINAVLRDWARVGELIRLEGRVGREQVVPAAWVRAMAAPSKANPGYGWQIWRGSPWVAQRRYSPEVPLAVPHSAPYAADDVLFLDGFGGQRVYVVPSAGLVIARTGQTDLTWDDAVLVNLALGGLPRKASMAAQASMAAKP